MPHNHLTDTSTSTSTRTDNDEWGWLSDKPPTPLPAISRQNRSDSDAEWLWLDSDSGAGRAAEYHSGTPQPRVTRRPGHRRIGLILATGVAALVTITVVLALHSGGGTTAAPGPATPPSTSPPSLAGACTGLSATTITSGQGDTSTMPGVIAAFEYAYYHLRSAAAAMLLLTPEAAISAETLAAGIASIPIGTTHCVAITPIADTTANVHLTELHPDDTRTDYLQVINVRGAGAGLLISNIQRQG